MSMRPTGTATPTTAASASRHRARATYQRATYHTAAGRANANASTGRIVAATPNANPASAPNAGRGVGDASPFASAAAPRRIHASAVTQFMYVPDRNTTNGAKANNTTAAAAVRPSGSATRRSQANATTASAPAIGPVSQARPSAVNGANMAGPPGGYWENTRPPDVTIWSDEKNSGCAGAGTHSRPAAKISAWRSCAISSIKSGRPLKITWATAAYVSAASTATATATRVRSTAIHCPTARARPAGHSAGIRRARIASTTAIPTTTAVPLTHSASWFGKSS